MAKIEIVLAKRISRGPQQNFWIFFAGASVAGPAGPGLDAAWNFYPLRLNFMPVNSGEGGTYDYDGWY
jgi:hypothetical protein